MITVNKLVADAVVIGGGVSGTAITYFLSKAGIKPLLVEQGYLNHGASGACDEGILLQSKNPGITMDLAVESAKLYRNLENELGYDIGYRSSGGMILINAEKYLPLIRNFVEDQQKQGLDIHMLNKKDTHDRQPGLSTNVIAGAYSKDDASVYPFRLTAGYVHAAQQLGAKMLWHNKIVGIKKHHQQIIGVTTSYHEITTPIVIDASGCGSEAIGKMVGLDIPVFPVRGQLVILEQVERFIHHQLLDAKFIVAKHHPELLEQNPTASELNVGLTLSQAPTGNLIIGGCREKSVPNTNISYTAIREIIKNAVEFFPILKDINIIRTFAGLRPSTPDNHPILSTTSVKGFYVATGMGGDGISLSPAVGKIMAELVTKGYCDIVDMDQLCLKRFFEV